MLRFIFNLFSRSIMVLLVAMLLVNYLPDKLFGDFPFDPSTGEPVDFDSAIPQWNTLLTDSNPEYIQLNNILGPESVAISAGGLVYTGLADGRLVELNPSNKYSLRQVLKFSQSPKCLDNVATRSNLCGRFLQLRFLNNTLYALESNTGLYKIDTKSGAKTLVGPKPLTKVSLYNGFVFDPVEPNIVYITISSTKWDLLNIVWSVLELEKTGRLIALDINTGKRVVVLDKVSFPNGVDADPKRDRLVFSETMLAQVSTVSLKQVREAFKTASDGATLKGIQKGSLIPLLPGNPDNIVVDGDLAYVSLPIVKLNGKELIDHLASMPNVRKAIGRFLFGLGKLLAYARDNLYFHPLLDYVTDELKTGHVIYTVIKNDKSAVVVYNLATGSSRLLGSGNFSYLSEATPDHKGNLLLGSFRSPFLVKVKV